MSPLPTKLHIHPLKIGVIELEAVTRKDHLQKQMYMPKYAETSMDRECSL